MEDIKTITWEECPDTVQYGAELGVVFDDADGGEMPLGVVFDDDELQTDWSQMELSSGELDLTAENLFNATDASAASIYIDKRLQTVVIPVNLKTKIVSVYLTQDSEYCKLYLTDILGSLPKEISMMVGDIIWVLPRARPVRNKRLLNKLFYKAQQSGAEQKDMLKTLSIRDVIAAAADDISEINYINSQLTLVDISEESEFGGRV